MKLKRIVFPCFENNESDISSEAEEQKVPRKSGSKVFQIICTINEWVLFYSEYNDIWNRRNRILGLSYLKSSNSKWALKMDQSSWIASAFDLGGSMGCLLYPFIIDRIGRKNSLIVFLLPQVLSWAMTYFANGFVLLCLARIISGIGYNAGTVVAFIYIGEIVDKNIRGLLVSFVAIAFSIGALVILIIGAFFSYHDMNLTFLTTSLLFIFLFPLMPESPYFYLNRNQEKDAIIKSLSKLRGKIIDSQDLQMEMKNIQEKIIKEEKYKNCLPSVFVKKGDRKALIIEFLLRASTILFGGAVLTKYSEDIFKYSGIDLAPEYGTIILIFLRVLAGIGMSPLFDYFGRRILILFSSAICSICLVVVGLFFFKFKDVDLSSIAWVPLVALTLFKASSSGLFSAVGLLGSEIFSIDVKKSALAFTTIAEQILSFSITLGFERTVSVFGIHYVLYAVMGFVPALISFCIMPETKGKSLEEIQKILASK